MTLQAGAALVDITPDHPVPLFGYPHVERISTGVHDPILSSALYLDNGSQKLVLISLDLLFLDPPTARSIRRAVAGRLSLTEARVFISCTHTHSAPVTSRLLAWQDDPAVPPPDPAYLQWLTERAVESAVQAAEGAEPAELACATAEAQGVGGNRLDPAGVTDPQAGILALRAAGGGPLRAVVVIYGMHPTVLHEDSTLVSSDFPHYTRAELKERFGPSLVVVYYTGACGNQSPRHFVRGATFAEAEQLGRALGRAVGAEVEKLSDQDFRAEVPLRSALGYVDLPRRPLPAVSEAEQQLQRYRADYLRLKSEQGKSAAVRTAECAVFGAEGTLALARLEEAGEVKKALAAGQPIELQTLRLGEVYVAGLPGEIFTEYSLEIKRRAHGRVFVVTLVNGDLQGYIVTPDAVAQGGYESMTALFGPAAGAVLVEAALLGVRDLAASEFD